MADRVDHEAERATLGAAFVSGEALALARAVVRPEDFADPARALVFAAVCALADVGQRVDRVTVGAELRRHPKGAWALERCDLGELALCGQGAEGAEAHAKIVAAHAEARRYRAAAEKILRAVDSPGTALPAVRALAADELGKIQARAAGASGPKSFADLAQEFYQTIEDAAARKFGTIDGLPTGIRKLDELLSGLHPGELVVVGARPRVGKSALVVQMAVAVARQTGRPVLGFSLEMTAVSLFGRAVHARAEVDSGAVRRATLTQADVDALVRATGELAELPVEIDDAGNTTVLDIRAKALAMKARRGDLALVFCDYTQLLESHTDRGNRVLDVSAMTRGLKQLAKELKAPVIALSQLSRKCEERGDKRPLLSDLRESGSIEQDADVVLFLYRDEIYDPQSKDAGIAEIICAKQRGGQEETVRVKWEGAFTRFADLERDDPRDEDDGRHPRREDDYDAE